jgi:hypothetical protein
MASDFQLLDVETTALGEGAARNARTLEQLEQLQHDFVTTAKNLRDGSLGAAIDAFDATVAKAVPVLQRLDEQLKIGGVDNLHTMQDNYEAFDSAGAQAASAIGDAIPGI